MSHGLVRRLAVATAAVGVLIPVGAGTAAACDGGHDNGRASNVAFRVAHHEKLGELFGVAQSYLGLSDDALRADLKGGHTLAQIADATPGKSAAGLVDTLNAAAKAKLDPYVAAGKLTSDQEAAILAKVATWVSQLVNTTWTSPRHARAEDAVFHHAFAHVAWHHHHHHHHR
jgi:hypothetical protein